jgi:hypothetical protein
LTSFRVAFRASGDEVVELVGSASVVFDEVIGLCCGFVAPMAAGAVGEDHEPVT